MTTLLVSVPGIIHAASVAKQQNTQLRQIVGRIDDRIDALRANFEGAAAEQYEATVDKWVVSASQLMDAVDGLTKFLNAAADAVQEVDAKLAAALQGGGSSDRIVADSEFLSTISSRTVNIANALQGMNQGFSDHGFHSNDISDALSHFTKDWSDARKNMIQSVSAAGEMTRVAADVFQQTDQSLMQAIKQ